MDAMVSSWQFSDLPQIPQGMSMTEDQSHHQAIHHPYGHMAFYGYRAEKANNYPREQYTYNNPMYPHMQPMQRFLDGNEPVRFVTSQYSLNHNGALPLQAQYLKRHNQPWPSPEALDFHARYDSPDRTSASGESSHCTQNELRSPPSYGSPKEIYQPGMSYPSPQLSMDGMCSPELPQATSGGICPRDIEIDHANFEHMTEDHDHEQTYMDHKSDLDYHQEPPVYVHTQHVEAEPDPDCYDPAIVNSYQKEESVQPAVEESDSDYTPIASKKRRLSSSSGSGQQSKGRRGSVKTPSNANRPKRGARIAKAYFNPRRNSGSYRTDERPFPCSFAVYGCQSKFSSKNEWKRHMSTQHIKLGFWRCDLCATTVDPHDDHTVYHNDFNRKDLFTQHLRRMHAAPQTKDATRTKNEHYPVNDSNITEHQKRCYQFLRGAPPKSSCMFTSCDVTFNGPTSWEERMEHVGRHLEKDRKPDMLDITTWRVDKHLEAWLIEEGLITFDGVMGWRIGDGQPKRDSEDEDA